VSAYVPIADTVEAHRADLESRGFRVIDCSPRNPDLRPGARVRNYGERWHEAIVEGTATVAVVLRRGTDEKPDSWELTYRRPNIEVIVERDPDRRDFGAISVWSDYGSCLAEKQTSAKALPTEGEN
jgi:hypothetical protein